MQAVIQIIHTYISMRHATNTQTYIWQLLKTKEMNVTKTWWKSALVWYFSEDALKTLQTLRSWISKKLDRNYSMHFTEQKTETGVWDALPALKGINIWQVSINVNEKAANLKDWRMVKGNNNCRDTLSDTDGEFCRELNELRVHRFLTPTHTHPFPQNASQDGRRPLSVSQNARRKTEAHHPKKL